MSVQRILYVYELVGVCIWQAEYVLLVVSRYYFMTILRVEVLYFLERCPCQVADLFEMEHFSDLECIDMYRH